MRSTAPFIDCAQPRRGSRTNTHSLFSYLLGLGDGSKFNSDNPKTPTMASLVLIAAILIAVKVSERHSQERETGEESLTEPSTSPKPQKIHGKHSSRREIFTRRYWYDQQTAGRMAQVESIGASPAYTDPPMYESVRKADNVQDDPESLDRRQHPQAGV
ncbi:uncharacterized protein BJX67DRAFT_378809 [Aspergillus lucknowensis]|uniref:Uncharacterized protein n=1 Tax=Aspergillus lucknowensis TaxID=176173 RepID=A0ABR4LYZ6_9EURO